MKVLLILPFHFMIDFSLYRTNREMKMGERDKPCLWGGVGRGDEKITHVSLLSKRVQVYMCSEPFARWVFE